MRRAWFRWSLRAAILAVAISGCALGYVAKVRRDRVEQERAIAAIEKLDGMVGSRPFRCMVYPDRRPVVDLCWDNPELVDADLAHLAWLTDLEYLRLDVSGVSDAGLVALGDLTSLESLSLASRETWLPDTRPGIPGELVTGRGLASLKNLKNLKSLDLWGINLKADDLAFLDGMTQLESLRIARSSIGDAGLAHLKGLTRLVSLDLDSCRIEGPGLVHLEGLIALESLGLASNPFADFELIHLEGLARLKDLDLEKTEVAGPGLAHLARLAKLDSLNLDGTLITDRGQEHLRGPASLRTLRIASTWITDAGERALRAAFPGAEIQF